MKNPGRVRPSGVSCGCGVGLAFVVVWVSVWVFEGVGDFQHFVQEHFPHSKVVKTKRIAPETTVSGANL